jgi:hypothetical protein
MMDSDLKHLSLSLGFILLSSFVLFDCGKADHLTNGQTLSAGQQQLAVELREVTKNYLVAKIGVVGFGGKVFCAHKVLALEESGDDVKEYVYVLCQEYYESGAELKKGTGLKLPVALDIQKQAGAYRVLSHQVPRDAGYKKEIERLFPQKTHDEIFSLESGGSNLQDEVDAEARNHFKTGSN